MLCWVCHYVLIWRCGYVKVKLVCVCALLVISPHSPWSCAVPWHCQVRSHGENLILDAVNYAGVWSSATTREGHLLLPLFKGTKLQRLRTVCVCVLLCEGRSDSFLLWFWDTTDAARTSCSGRSKASGLVSYVFGVSSTNEKSVFTGEVVLCTV